MLYIFKFYIFIFFRNTVAKHVEAGSTQAMILDKVIKNHCALCIKAELPRAKCRGSPHST